MVAFQELLFLFLLQLFLGPGGEGPLDWSSPAISRSDQGSRGWGQGTCPSSASVCQASVKRFTHPHAVPNHPRRQPLLSPFYRRGN